MMSREPRRQQEGLVDKGFVSSLILLLLVQAKEEGKRRVW